MVGFFGNMMFLFALKTGGFEFRHRNHCLFSFMMEWWFLSEAMELLSLCDGSFCVGRQGVDQKYCATVPPTAHFFFFACLAAIWKVPYRSDLNTVAYTRAMICNPIALECQKPDFMFCWAGERRGFGVRLWEKFAISLACPNKQLTIQRCHTVGGIYACKYHIRSNMSAIFCWLSWGKMCLLGCFNSLSARWQLSNDKPPRLPHETRQHWVMFSKSAFL